MKFTAMDTQEGNALVERIIDAAAKMHVMQGATNVACVQFMYNKILTLSGGVGFEEANQGKVYSDAVDLYSDTVQADAMATSFS
jgi:hypothetical protein